MEIDQLTPAQFTKALDALADRPCTDDNGNLYMALIETFLNAHPNEFFLFLNELTTPPNAAHTNQNSSKRVA